MKVLFLMFVFPDMNSSFNMYTALVQQFYLNGHQVFVLAPELGNGRTRIIKEKDIDILRVRILPIKNVSHFLKGISNLLLPFKYAKALKNNYPDTKFDLLITPTPPITLVDLAASIKKKYGLMYYLILRDIFPQNAVDLGIMKDGWIIHRYFRAKELKLYRLADFIGCMSPGNIKYVLNHNKGIKTEKLHELKNYQFLYSFDQGSAGNTAIRSKYGLSDKFVVVFGGNMGKPQQLENVIELAKRCKEYPDVIFLLLGEGVAMQKLRSIVKNLNIENIQIRGTIPKHEYQNLISVCDLGLISLNEDYTIPNIPSKTLDYFNVGLPIIASIDKATDYNDVLEEAGAGLWSYAGDHDTFKKNFDTLYYDKMLRCNMGKNGRIYFEKFLTPEIAYETIMDKVQCINNQ